MLLSEKARKAVDVRVYGENRHWLGGDFDRRLRALFEAAEGVRRFGSYRNEDAVKLMRNCDWIVVPSIWWENAPVVIAEAKVAGCGIICSDIGGMAEKTDDAIDRRFPAGNAPALAELIEEIAFGDRPADDDAREARAAESGAARDRAVEAHIEVYKSLIKNKTRGRVKHELAHDAGSLVSSMQPSKPGSSVR
jgi:glycosyltransferase involved in cell wall biosynthesis